MDPDVLGRADADVAYGDAPSWAETPQCPPTGVNGERVRENPDPLAVALPRHTGYWPPGHDHPARYRDTAPPRIGPGEPVFENRAQL
jgi:hypothetical protein